MKWLVFLLVLANLLFFSYTEGYIAQVPNPDSLRLKKQVRPDDIRVVSRDVPPPAKTEAIAANKEEAPQVSASSQPNPAQPAPVATAPAAEACLAWGGLFAKEADRLAALLTEKFADFKQARRTEAAVGKSWWVFIPPLSSKAEADKKAGELKQLGIKDFIVVQDTEPKPLAVSLGIFSSEAAAKTRLGQLRDKGVRSAKLEPYSGKEVLAIEARGPAARRQALLDATQAISSMKLEVKACQ